MTAVEHPVIPDGLRAWQAAVINLWSAGEDSFATLILHWFSEDLPGAPWIVRLVCGDNGQDNWSEEVKIAGAPNLPQALQKLWHRAQVHHELFQGKDLSLPDDFPENAWLEKKEQKLIDNLCKLLKSRHPIALHLSYHPDLGLSSRWVAILHDPEKQPPEGVLLNVSGAHLTEACQMLLDAIKTEQKGQ